MAGNAMHTAPPKCNEHQATGVRGAAKKNMRDGPKVDRDKETTVWTEFT